MNQTIEQKAECPEDCNDLKYMHVYDEKIGWVEMELCYSRMPMQYSLFAEFPEMGLLKVCRRSLYKETGLVGVVE